MSILTGKEALIALANGEEVEFSSTEKWYSLKYSNVHVKCILNDSYEFRLKPRTITINGIEAPAPFEPKDGEKYFYLNLQRECLYAAKEFNGNYSDNSANELGAWRTEEEIRQVVAALRQVLGGAK